MSLNPSTIARTIIATAALTAMTACSPSEEKSGGGASQSGLDAETTSTPVAAAATTAPAAFGACSVCHSTEPDKILMGPSLFGVVGRAAGSMPNYAYSPAMQGSGITWTAETLDAFVASPHSVVAGTKMPYAGLRDAQKRTDVIRYLETLK